MANKRASPPNHTVGFLFPCIVILHAVALLFPTASLTSLSFPNLATLKVSYPPHHYLLLVFFPSPSSLATRDLLVPYYR